MMGRSPRSCISSFVAIGYLVLERVFTIYWCGDNLGHVTILTLKIFVPLPKKAPHRMASGFGEEDV